jgi:hypothetical protein
LLLLPPSLLFLQLSFSGEEVLPLLATRYFPHLLCADSDLSLHLANNMANNMTITWATSFVAADWTTRTPLPPHRHPYHRFSTGEKLYYTTVLDAGRYLQCDLEPFVLGLYVTVTDYGFSGAGGGLGAAGAAADGGCGGVGGGGGACSLDSGTGAAAFGDPQVP